MHTTIRLPTPDRSDPRTASADVFRRCALCDHWLRPIGKQNHKSLETPLFSPAAVHDVGLFSEGGRIALSQFGSAGQRVNQVNTRVSPSGESLRDGVLSCPPRFRWRTQMDEQRKYAIPFSATILAARKLSEVGVKPCPARECAISDAISNAELILRRIDERWPSQKESLK